MGTIDIEDTVFALAEKGVSLQVSGDKLIVRGNLKAIDSGLKQQLKAYKAEIVDYVLSRQQARTQKTIQPQIHDRKKVMSSAQRRLWFLDQLHNNATALYNIPFAVKITGDFDVIRAEKSLRDVVMRHEVLRTVYQSSQQGPQQILKSQVEDILRVEDLRDLDVAEHPRLVQDLIKAEVVKPFDLSRDTMLRGMWIWLGPAEGVLVFALHHIAADGWSIAILIEEFSHFYRSHEYTASQSAQGASQLEILKKLPIQYSDFSVWQNQYLQTTLAQSHLTYWLEHLADTSDTHALPLDFERKATNTTQGAVITSVIGSSMLSSLEALARRHDVTVFMILHAILIVLISRHSGGERDIIIGTPVANRQLPELECLVGCFVNTLALRVRWQKDIPFSELLQKVKKINLDALSHQDIPFDMLVDKLKLERSPLYAPLFQIMFSMNTFDSKSLALNKMRLESLAIPSDCVQSKFDLTLNATPENGGLTLSWLYATELFKKENVERISTHFRNLLRGVLSNQECRLSHLPVLTSAENDLLLGRPNPNGKGMVNAVAGMQIGHCDIERSVFKQMIANPDSIAIRTSDSELSYRALGINVLYLSNRLVEQYSLRGGDTVIIYCERSSELMVAMLTCLSLGLAYVPVDPYLGRERLFQVLKETQIHLVITQSKYLPSLSETHVFCEALDIKKSPEDGAANLLSLLDQDKNLCNDRRAYILYTSGSTGKPKGVAISYAGLSDYLFSALKRYYCQNAPLLAQKLLHAEHSSFSSGDVANTIAADLCGSFVVTSHSFDLVIPSLWLPLMTGGTVEFANSGEEVESLARACLENRGPFLIRITPLHVDGLLSLLPANTSLYVAHVFVVGGAVFSAALAKRLQSHFPNSQIFNHYGPTETVVGCCIYDASEHLRSFPEDELNLPIGKEIGDTQLYILGPELELLPHGCVGELCIGGAGVAQEYVNLPGQTKERFIESSFDQHNNVRLYRSGDLAKFKEDGNVIFIGRNDRQVKIKGFRVELGEIEHRLNTVPHVQSSLVQVNTDKHQHQHLVAYVLPTTLGDSGGEGGAISDETRAHITSICREALSKQLPAYMQPQVYVVLASWPLTANGKLDRRNLPEPQRKDEHMNSTYIAPKTDFERILVTLVAEVLDTPTSYLSVSANFFASGGDSIKALMFITRAREKGLHFSVRDVFSHQTVMELAALAKLRSEQGDDKENTANVPGLITSAVSESEAYPLTPMQHVMVDHYRQRNLRHYEGVYHVQTAIEFDRNALQVKVLKKAILLTYDKTPMLRTRIKIENGHYVQCVDNSLLLKFQELRLEEHHNFDSALTKIMRNDREECFEVPNDSPLVRFTFLYLSDDSIVLIISIHHAIIDGWSSGEITNQILSFYDQLISGKSIESQNGNNVFREYASLLNTAIENKKNLGFWKKQCKRINVYCLDAGGKEADSGSQSAIFDSIPGPKMIQVESTRSNVSFRAIYCHALLQAVLCWTQGACNTVGVLVNGRSEDLSDPLHAVGLFWNMLPLILADSGLDKTRQTALNDTHCQLLALETHSQIGLSELENIHRESHGQALQSPLFFATMNYMDFHNRANTGFKGSRFLRQYSKDKLHYPLNFAIHPSHDREQATLRVEYDSRYLSDIQAREIIALFVERLKLALAMPSNA